MKRRIWMIALGLSLLLCACAEKADVLSEEEIALLREEYPITTSWYFGDGVELEYAMSLSVAVAEITVLRDYFVSYEQMLLPVRVDTLLYNTSELKEGDEINLRFGAAWAIYTPEFYTIDGRYICFITPEGEYDSGKPKYGSTKQVIAYLTEDDYILALEESGPFWEYNGYALESFKAVLDKLV